MSAGADRSDMRALVETEMFALLDADKDGAISDAEYKAANKRENKQLARKRAMFKTAGYKRRRQAWLRKKCRILRKDSEP